MGHENIDGVNYTVRERIVDGKSQQIYYNDGKAYIKDEKGELQNLVKTKDSIFTKAEYETTSKFDYNCDGIVSKEEQAQALEKELRPFYEKVKETFDKNNFDFEEFKNKYISRFKDIGAKGKENANLADSKVELTNIQASMEILNKSKEYTEKELIDLQSDITAKVYILASSLDSSDKAKEEAEYLKSIIKDIMTINESSQKWGDEMLDALNTMYPEKTEDEESPADKLRRDAKSLAPVFGLENPVSEETKPKIHVLGQHDPKDVKEGDYAVSGNNTYQYKDGRWIKVNTNPQKDDSNKGTVSAETQENSGDDDSVVRDNSPIQLRKIKPKSNQ